MTQACLTDARSSIKTAVGKTETRRESLATWPDVLRALQGDAARSEALTRYRAAGFGPDDFAHRRAAREAMADALTRAEDFVELAGSDRASRRAERQTIRDVRRRLERELWP